MTNCPLMQGAQCMSQQCEWWITFEDFDVDQKGDGCGFLISIQILTRIANSLRPAP